MLRFAAFSILFLACTPLVWAEKTQLEGVVNVNTASPEELRLIPSVGPARIRNILAYRRAHPFRTVDELVRIKGIGRKTVRRWRQHLAVSGPSTAARVVRPETPFVGPPSPAAALPPPMAGTAKAATARPMDSARPAKPLRRGGEPSRGVRAAGLGNRCLPPP